MPIPDPIVATQAGFDFVDVIDNATGQRIADVVRASPAGGWYDAKTRDEAGELVLEHGKPVVERVERAIRYELRPEAPPFYQHKWA